MNAQLIWNSGCRLGEGTVWNAADASLYFVDIKHREVLAITPATGVRRRWSMPQMIGWLVPRAQGGWLAGFQQGVAALTLDAVPRWDLLHRLHDEGSSLRLNDAKADAQGRLWFGSMNNDFEDRPEGRFYRWVAGSDPVEVDAGYCVTNGPAFSPDGRTLYHTDSVARTIYAFDVSVTGALSGKRVFAVFTGDEGYPDGMTTDAAGDLWVAHWAGGRVTRHDARGQVLQTIRVNAPNVTNVAFGGPDLNDLYISTARDKLSDAALAQAPESGGLFVVPGAGQGRSAGVFAG